MIKLQNISVYFEERGKKIMVLNRLNLEIEKGTWCSITGRSGSGKSTLLNSINGIIVPDEGEVYINGRNSKDMDDDERSHLRRNEIGYVFQDFKLLPHYTVLDNVILPLLFEVKKETLINRAVKLLEEVGIGQHLHQKLPEKLSGGERQRVAIARALIAEPKILLCDEPTGNLDIENRNQIADLLMKIKDTGRVVVVVTHDIEIAQLGDVHYSLNLGTLEKVGDTNV